MPVKSEPSRNSGKDDSISPTAPIAAPKAPPKAPATNPAVRPYFAMKLEIGVAVSMEPMTIKLIGSVAQQAFGASDCPASPPMVKIIGICAPKIAWAATSTRTLRLARLSSMSWGMGGLWS